MHRKYRYPSLFDRVAFVWDDNGVYFEIVGEISPMETIAAGSGIRELARLRQELIMAKPTKRLVVCVKNNGYVVSLERRKLYVSIADAVAERHELMRIVDESGDDYLYPRKFFVRVELPESVRRAVLLAA